MKRMMIHLTMTLAATLWLSAVTFIAWTVSVVSAAVAAQQEATPVAITGATLIPLGAIGAACVVTWIAARKVATFEERLTRVETQHGDVLAGVARIERKFDDLPCHHMRCVGKQPEDAT